MTTHRSARSAPVVRGQYCRSAAYHQDATRALTNTEVKRMYVIRVPHRGGVVHCEFHGRETRRDDGAEVHRTVFTVNGGIVVCYVEVDGVVVATYLSADLIVDPVTLIVSCAGELVGWFVSAEAA